MPEAYRQTRHGSSDHYRSFQSAPLRAQAGRAALQRVEVFVAFARFVSADGARTNGVIRAYFDNKMVLVPRINFALQALCEIVFDLFER